MCVTINFSKSRCKIMKFAIDGEFNGRRFEGDHFLGVHTTNDAENQSTLLRLPQHKGSERVAGCRLRWQYLYN